MLTVPQNLPPVGSASGQRSPAAAPPCFTAQRCDLRL